MTQFDKISIIFLIIVAILVASITCANLRLVTTTSRLPTPIYETTAVYDGQDSIYITGGVIDYHNDVLEKRLTKYSISTGDVKVVGVLGLAQGVAFMNG